MIAFFLPVMVSEKNSGVTVTSFFDESTIKTFRFSFLSVTGKEKSRISASPFFNCATIFPFDEKILKEVFVEMKMWNERRDKIKSVLWSTFVHINMRTQKPENHSKELMELFKPFENPLPSTSSFDERVEQLR